MKIISVSFTNHQVLGNLFLEMTDIATGLKFPTVVFAGENGTGKSILLEEIYRLIGDLDLNRKSELSIIFEMSEEDINLLRIRFDAPDLKVKDRILQISRGADFQNGWGNISIIFEHVDGTKTSRSAFDYFREDRPHRTFRSFLSEAGVGFISGNRNSITATALDNKVNANRSGPQIAQKISQLIVDIRTADNEDLSRWVEENPGVPVNAENHGIRMRRFSSAIEYMFPSKRLKTVVAQNGNYEILFDENGRITTLDQLSTGEKQIFFRGGFLLQDLASAIGAIILIDEPELGLHPEWQAKILGFYRHIFGGPNDITTQILIATHSPFIVHDRDTDSKVIILQKNNANGSIDVDPNPTYPTTGHNLIVKAFKVNALISSAPKELVLLVEGESDKQIIKTAWLKLRPNSELYFDVSAALSDHNIRVILNSEQTFHRNANKKIVGLFDFDESFNQWKGVWNKNGIRVVSDVNRGLTRRRLSGMGWSMLLPVPPFRRDLASEDLGSDSVLSIELMFEDSDHLPKMITQHPLPVAGGHTKPKMNDSMKMEFARHVASLPPKSFAAFRNLFEIIEEIRNGAI